MEGTNLSCKKPSDPILLFQNCVQCVLIILNNIIQVLGYLCSCNFMEEKKYQREKLLRKLTTQKIHHVMVNEYSTGPVQGKINL